MGFLKFYIACYISVFLHELGHYTVFKLYHVRVKEFVVGSGSPKLRARFNETLIELSPFPFSGHNLPCLEFDKLSLLKKLQADMAGIALNFLVSFISIYIITKDTNLQLLIKPFITALKILWSIDPMNMYFIYAIADATIFMIQQGAESSFLFMLFSLNLIIGISNLLPLPGTDGSKLFMYLFERLLS